jgi:predicted nucleic acid-binding protein
LSQLAYTLDTNAILYYLKDDSNAVSLLREIFAHDAPLYISAITELELFAYPKLSAQEEALIEELLRTVSVIPLDSHIARLASFIRRQYRLKVPDSVIAATAIYTGSTLATRNTRDFKRVTALALLKRLKSVTEEPQ